MKVLKCMDDSVVSIIFGCLMTFLRPKGRSGDFPLFIYFAVYFDIYLVCYFDVI